MKLSNHVLAALWIALAGLAAPTTGVASDRYTIERHSAPAAGHFQKVSGKGHDHGWRDGHGDKHHRHGHGHDHRRYGHGHHKYGHGHHGHHHRPHYWRRHYRPHHWHHHSGHGYGHSGWYHPGYFYDGWDIILRYHFH